MDVDINVIQTVFKDMNCKFNSIFTILDEIKQNIPEKTLLEGTFFSEIHTFCTQIDKIKLSLMGMNISVLQQLIDQVEDNSNGD